MPGQTTVQGFPYPTTDEASTPVSAQNLATEADVELTAADAQRVLALNRPTAQARRAIGSSQTVNFNTATVLTFDTEDWDTGALYAPGTPNRFTITTPGVYYCMGTFQDQTSPSTVAEYEASFFINSTLSVALNKRGQYADPAPLTDVTMVTTAMLYRFAAADFVQLRGFWLAASGVSRPFVQATMSIRLVAV